MKVAHRKFEEMSNTVFGKTEPSLFHNHSNASANSSLMLPVVIGICYKETKRVWGIMY